ncbi:hypothetical protein [Pseudomonas sp. LFM046]|uniref:hypothetical protein n=1 Tax=Pseudomonas sp. LFM046 TaxID=1608357 RepID=UPI000A78CFFA|nr:hypothetical protein [Pseudomonas sp. LFM046]
MPTALGIPCMCMKGDTRRFFNGLCLACQGTGIKNPAREGTLRHNFEVKRPTLEEYQAFDGAHCRNIYKGLVEDWQCPGCTRTKYHILRWTVLYPNKPGRRLGWAGGYHEHHDHAGDKFGWQLPSWFTPRFEPTVVCEQCNSADASAKRKLKLPKDFSFSPWEIRQFVLAWAHGKHLIDYQRAQAIYSALPPPPTRGLFWAD